MALVQPWPGGSEGGLGTVTQRTGNNGRHPHRRHRLRPARHSLDRPWPRRSFTVGEPRVLPAGSRFRGDVSHALRRSSIRGVVEQESCLLEYGPCLLGMAAAGDDVIAGRGERLR